uniref:Antitoxin n=1 Tax=Gracilinema caldarium TaxID=215591 RepID=A0A7C3EJ35_9SPIR
MREEYDFEDSIKNPYIPKLKKPITIRLDNETIVYFKKLARDSGIPYQTLMNYFLTQCNCSCNMRIHRHRA